MFGRGLWIHRLGIKEVSMFFIWQRIMIFIASPSISNRNQFLLKATIQAGSGTFGSYHQSWLNDNLLHWLIELHHGNKSFGPPSKLTINHPFYTILTFMPLFILLICHQFSPHSIADLHTRDNLQQLFSAPIHISFRRERTSKHLEETHIV